MKKKNKNVFLHWRFRFILLGFIVIVAILISRIVFLTILDRDFLLRQGNARSLRTISIPAYRGMILDRNNEPLAVSTEVNSIWINPKDFPRTKSNVKTVSKISSIKSTYLDNLLKNNASRQFIYVKRGVNPDIANKIKQLEIPGIYLEKEYKRYYPTSEITSQIVGFTNIDEKGVEGLELAFNGWLKGKDGKEKILKDLYGNKVAVISKIRNESPGKDLYLSIDNRIQFLAYRVLKETVKKHNASSGSVVVLNPNTGEVLAMANQPSYNPNKPNRRGYDRFRNRAVTDLFEPGSTMKIFSIVSALKSGKYTPDTIIDTNPGWFKIGHNKIHDVKDINHGKLTVEQILQKSSNVGVAKIILSLEPSDFIDILKQFGFTKRTNSGFPGENAGALNEEALLKPFVLATMAFGYGVSVTPLQLAAAYNIIANQGLQCPITFLKRTEEINCKRIFDKKIVEQALQMLESVVSSGSGRLARIKKYRVAGKTGTANIAVSGGYDTKRYESSFVGMAPVSNPQLVIAIVIREPQGKYYGGVVAAPAFAEIMGGSLRILNITPDNV